MGNSLPALRGKTLKNQQPTDIGGTSSSSLAFGASSSRVIDSSNDRPPPGSYYTKELRDATLLRTPSLSNRGYVSGFVSQDTHERAFNLPKATKDIGAYHIPGSMESTRKTMNWQGNSYPFLGEPSDRVCCQDSVTRRIVPGPATYHPDKHYDSRGPKYNQQMNHAAFKSVTNRRSLYHAALQSSNSPGPANYSPVRPISPCSAAWSHSYSSRFDDAGSPLRMSSPGSVAHSPTHITRCRSAGNNKGSKGKLFEAPSSPIRFFGTEAKGPSFLGNMIEKSAVPGPGAYQLRPDTVPTALPGQSITGESSMFCSASQNHVVQVRRGPGPAYYSPKSSYDQKIMTLSNVDNHWLV